MARLPVPGGDKNSWGDLLNDFLQQAHDADGMIRDGSVTTAKLATDVQAAFGGTVDKQWIISGPVNVASGDVDYIAPAWLSVPAGYTAQITTVRARINSGTNATIRLTLNGTTLSGLSSVVVTPSGTTLTGLALPVADGNQLAALVLSTAGSPQNMTIMVSYKLTKV